MATTKKVDNIEQEAREIEKATYEAVKKEKTIRYKFPLLGYKDAYEFVEGAVNGVDFRFARGEFVEIPESIFALLEETGRI